MWQKRWFMPALITVLALAGVFFALHLMHSMALPRAQLVTLAGQMTDLPTLSAGKPTVVNLWATWCPPCRLEMPYLAAAQKQEPGINFVFVDEGEDLATVERYLSSVRLDLANVVLDPANKLGQEIGSSSLPVTLFFDASGRMVDSRIGALTPAILAEKMARVRPSSR